MYNISFSLNKSNKQSIIDTPSLKLVEFVCEYLSTKDTIHRTAPCDYQTLRFAKLASAVSIWRRRHTPKTEIRDKETFWREKGRETSPSDIS